MYKFLPAVVEYVHKHRDIQKNNILVHCVAGKQRSTIYVTAYLVAKHNMTPLHFSQALVKFDNNTDKRPFKPMGCDLQPL